MSVKPILFNTEMVRAILDGQKTVTRRAIKNLPKSTYSFTRVDENLWEYNYAVSGNGVCMDLYGEIKAPCQPGDILYVREAYCPNYFDEGIAGYRGDLRGNRNAYKADYHKDIVGDVVPEPKWRPSIHMPKEAARIWLKVTDVRVERLQDITEGQAKAEGANCKNGKNVGIEEKMHRTAIDRFTEIWDSTITKSDLDRYGWEANPWVWVIEFERCEKTKSEE